MNDLNIADNVFLESNFDEDFESPRTTNIESDDPSHWTIITALNRVLSLARGSELSNDFWHACKNPLAYLREQLGLTDIQIVVLAILVESGEPLSWRGIGRYLNCTRLSIMTYTEEIEELLEKRWIVRRGTRELGGCFEGFALEHGVIKALRHNEVFVPEKIDGLQIQEFIERLECHLDKNLNDRNSDFCDCEVWMLQLCKANPDLNLCQEVLKYDYDIHIQSLLMMIVYDYAQWAGSEGEGLTLRSIDHCFPEDYETDGMRKKLRNGTHILIQAGTIEHKCEEGIADNERYVLTRSAKESLLVGYAPSQSKSSTRHHAVQNLRLYSSIIEKEMFYNQEEEEQITQLADLLSKEKLPSIQERLEKEGMRKGFACLFYGQPGTGKTETVLQLARMTGRDIMQIDIAGMRDKYVGESEKNIKAVFQNYREVCKSCDVQPILFFNEADALINKRMQNVEHSVDKMDNAMQNILLQEIEDLDGILIATTNLTSNLDDAFDRRFLFKVEFKKPGIQVKTDLWRSMLGSSITEDEAHLLASKFDFSGGQIENIARKQTINYILSGRHASLEDIEKFCQKEILNKKKDRVRIGF